MRAWLEREGRARQGGLQHRPAQPRRVWPPPKLPVARALPKEAVEFEAGTSTIFSCRKKPYQCTLTLRVSTGAACAPFAQAVTGQTDSLTRLLAGALGSTSSFRPATDIQNLTPEGRFQIAMK